jgi:hypothetical protein
MFARVDLAVALVLGVVGCRVEACNRKDQRSASLDSADSASEPVRAPVWFSFRGPQMAGQGADKRAHAFVVTPSGEFCVRVAVLPQLLYHGGGDADDCADAPGIWCRGRLDEKDVEALEALLKEEALGDYVKSAIPAHGARFYTPEVQALHVMGLRQQLLTPEDPREFHRMVGLFVYFGETSKLSERAKRLVQTLVDVRDRATAANSCTEPAPNLPLKTR